MHHPWLHVVLGLFDFLVDGHRRLFVFHGYICFIHGYCVISCNIVVKVDLVDLVYFLLQHLRFYFPTSLGLPVEVLSLMLNNAFNELAEMDQRLIIGEEPIFNLVPVLGAGSSATSMDNILTCELFASKS